MTLKLVHVYVAFACLFTWCSITPALSMNQPPYRSPKLIQSVIEECLAEKKTDMFYQWQCSEDYGHEDQVIFPYKTSFANQKIDLSEKKYASYSNEQQAEFSKIFSEVVKNIHELQTSQAHGDVIKKCISESYEKLPPLVWRVRLIWVLRGKTSNMFNESLATLYRCAPCKYAVLERFMYLVFMLGSYYYTVRDILSDTSALRYIMPFLCVFFFYKDVIKKAISDYRESKEYIKETFAYYYVWKEITDELAHTMEDTYRPL